MLKSFRPTFNLEGPNNLIYKFDGNVQYEKKNAAADRNSKNSLELYDKDDALTTVPLSNDNVLLRGMSLKNTEWVIGIVVYTGHQTKI